MPYNVKMFRYENGIVQTRLYTQGILYGEDRIQNEEQKPTRNTNENPDSERALQVSMNRTKQQIYQIALANQWEIFVTMTFNQEYVDRHDYKACSKVLSMWLNNTKRSVPQLAYIFVPEPHEDGAWHYHGLMKNIKGLKLADSGKTTKTGDTIYNLPQYKYGFTTATYVKDTDKVSGYITKYITKDLCKLTKGKKRYWASRNVNLPEIETYCIDTTERFVLEQELRLDCDYEKISLGKNIPQHVRYFQNQTNTFAPEFDQSLLRVYNE